MKLLTKEQEAAHYRATLTGGIIGGVGGLGIGAAGVLLASRRYHFFRQLTLPLKAFLITSAGTFSGIVSADHYSRGFEKEQNPIDVQYQERERQRAEEAVAGKTFTERALDFGKKERYKIVGGSWVASMIAAFAIVNRNKYLTGQQKLVQARVYAQFLTVGVLVATAAFEVSDQRSETGRYEKVRVLDPKDPEHKRYIEQERPVEQSEGDSSWKEMVAAEEQRLKDREEDEERIRKQREAKRHKKEKQHKQEEGQQDKKAGESKDGSRDKAKQDGDQGKDAKKDQQQGDKVASANDAKNKK